MKVLSANMKEEALKDLKMYYGKPPYDVEHIRRSYRSSGLFEQQALVKYGRSPLESSWVEFPAACGECK